jgi:hypothetical protein
MSYLKNSHVLIVGAKTGADSLPAAGAAFERWKPVVLALG